MAEQPDFSGTISDLGGPTANMYQMNCSRPEMREKCRRLSCLRPTICPLLATDHGPLIRAAEGRAAAAGREAGVGGLGHSHGPGPAQPGVHPPGRPAPHGRPAEGRPRTYRPGGAAADAQAADRGSSRRSPGSSSSEAAAAGKQAVPRAVFHRRASGLRPAGDDRPGACI